MALRIELVTDTARFSALREPWNLLVERSPHGFITLTWEWLFTWWEVYGDQRQLWVLIAWDGDRMVGAAPLHGYVVQRLGVDGVRLAFLGSGEREEDETCSDYLDVLVDAAHHVEFWNALRERLLTDTCWDEILLESVRAESPTVAAARGLEGRRVRCSVTQRAECVEVPLPQDGDELLRQLGPKMRAQIRRHRRLLSELGQPSFTAREGDDIDPHFSSLVALHQAWWRARGRPGCFSSSRFLTFHRTLAGRLGPGVSNIHLLSVDQTPVAARYSFTFKDTVFEYQGGVDPDFRDSRIGLGVLCTAACMEDAIARGLRRYDFGEGVQSYKQRWGGRVHATVNVRLTRWSTRRILWHLVESGEQTLRKLARRPLPTAGASTP